nr:hypothetical protein Iba_chr04bCG19420 [Ipomoea batatas]
METSSPTTARKETEYLIIVSFKLDQRRKDILVLQGNRMVVINESALRSQSIIDVVEQNCQVTIDNTVSSKFNPLIPATKASTEAAAWLLLRLLLLPLPLAPFPPPPPPPRDLAEGEASEERGLSGDSETKESEGVGHAEARIGCESS